MFSNNDKNMEENKKKLKVLSDDNNYIPGIVKSWAPEQTLQLSRLPEYVKRQAQKFLF